MPQPLLNLDDALARIFAMADQLGTETVDLTHATGRVLAAPVTAQITQPPFNASAMDGYAMAAADAKTGAELTQIGVSQAGSGFDGTLAPGQCIRIFTGAPLPPSADTVIMQENTEATGATIKITQGAEQGNNVRRAGQDFSQGETLITPGTRLTPAHIALAAAGNNARVTVTRQPKIALLSTGDELVPPGSPVAADQIVSSNAAALQSLLKPYAASVTDLGIAPDDEPSLTAMMQNALDDGFDAIITIGGASVGDHDLVQPVLKNLGVEIDFWKIAMRPGKPFMAGKKGDTLIFGLPGNPVSAYVTATVLVIPALRHIAGESDPLGPRLILPLSTPLPANGPRRHFVRATIDNTPDGTKIAPISQTDSAHLSSLATANALIIHAENAPELPEGSLVTCILLNA